MPDVKLGNRHECSECNAKFYDLGRTQAVCPKCATVQQAKNTETTSRKRRKSPAVIKTPEDEHAEDEEEELGENGDENLNEGGEEDLESEDAKGAVDFEEDLEEIDEDEDDV